METDSRGYIRTDSLQEIKDWCHKIILKNREEGRKVLFTMRNTPGKNNTVKNYPVEVVAYITKGDFPKKPNCMNMKEYSENNFVLHVAVSTNVLDASYVFGILVSVIAVPEGGWITWLTIIVLVLLMFLPTISTSFLKKCIVEELKKDGIDCYITKTID
ncbi:MAG TPA: hypothetical protein P5511_00790 [Candidatus Goldiibacteriota bacterium]|nr:hypothetical protein [Candidatus Goldiibacteriota bacterium]